MCWKPRNNNRWSQSKEGIKHQRCLLKSFGYYGKSIKSVLKARHAIRQPSTPSAQYSHIPAISQHFVMWSTSRLCWQCTDRTCFTLHFPRPLSSPFLSPAAVPAKWWHPQSPPGTHPLCCRASCSWNTQHVPSSLEQKPDNSQLLNFFPPPTDCRQSKYVFKQGASMKWNNTSLAVPNSLWAHKHWFQHLLYWKKPSTKKSPKFQ